MFFQNVQKVSLKMFFFLGMQIGTALFFFFFLGSGFKKNYNDLCLPKCLSDINHAKLIHRASGSPIGPLLHNYESGQ